MVVRKFRSHSYDSVRFQISIQMGIYPKNPIDFTKLIQIFSSWCRTSWPFRGHMFFDVICSFLYFYFFLSFQDFALIKLFFFCIRKIDSRFKNICFFLWQFALISHTISMINSEVQLDSVGFRSLYQDNRPCRFCL